MGQSHCILPGLTMANVAMFLGVAIVLTFSVVGGNPAVGGNRCVIQLQKHCSQEVDSLQSREGKDACGHLSQAITCIGCKLPNCTHIGASLVEQYGTAPYKCPIDNSDIVLIQGGEKAVQLCLLMTTAQPMPKRTESLPKTPKPSVTPSEHQQGKQTQSRNNNVTNGSTTTSAPSICIGVLCGLMVLLSQWR